MEKFFTPRGTEIKEYDKIVGEFSPKDYGDVMSREEWLECVENGDFIPYDGTLGEIVIDEMLTCYELEGWNMGFYLTFGDEKVIFRAAKGSDSCYRIKEITMDEFKALEGNVKVCWYNR